MLLVLCCISSAVAQKTIHIPTDQLTIQAGINAASTGDTVLVAPGIYHENIDFKGKAITVTSSAGPSTTTIDGGGTDATVTFQSRELRSSVISNLTIRNGGNAANTQGYSGGGIYVSNAAPSILNNVITANINHAIQVEFGAALIQGNELSDTLGTGYTFFDGSAVILSGNSQISGSSNSILIGNIIENNLHAHEYDGGGIGLWAVEGTVIQGNIIRNNATTGTGGAIYSANTDQMYIIDNLIYGNLASGGSLVSSGGISILAPSESIGPFIGVIEGNTIAGNTILPGSSNISGEAGEQMALERNLGQYIVVNNIIVGSSSSLPAVVCGTIYNYLSLTPLVFDHNDIYNAKGASYGGACPDQTGSFGNISADPGFSIPGTDYTLRAGSPAIDAGNNSAPQMPTTDLAGSHRIQDATAKGYPVVDL